MHSTHLSDVIPCSFVFLFLVCTFSHPSSPIFCNRLDVIVRNVSNAVSGIKICKLHCIAGEFALISLTGNSLG